MNPQQSIFKCKHCHTPLGVTVGNRLTVAAMKIGEPGRSVTVECPSCGMPARWRPERGVVQTGQLPSPAQAA